MLRKLLVAAFAAMAVVFVIPANPAHAYCAPTYVCLYKSADYTGGEAPVGAIEGYYPILNFTNGGNVNDQVTSVKNRAVIVVQFYVNSWWSGDSFKLNPYQYTSNVGSRFNDKLSSHT
ncbi:peptidase inhibitor family I36 protein [Micromonospora sp. BQ11]|uniref:peptidase inhibitor family I36 protein n=1 Tax=Micromonospora sp. BQ11 TaxID=3452212 RepID=UPI003F889982